MTKSHVKTESAKPAPWRQRPKVSPLTIGLAILLVAGSVGLIVLVQIRPGFFTEVPQILYQLFITLVSVALGAKFTGDQAKQKEAEKWVNEAANAADALLSLDTNILTRRAERTPTCDLIVSEYRGQVDSQVLDRMKRNLGSRCRECEHFETTVRRTVEQHVRTWQQFIELSCGGSACEYFTKRVEDRLAVLELVEAKAQAAKTRQPAVSVRR